MFQFIVQRVFMLMVFWISLVSVVIVSFSSLILLTWICVVDDAVVYLFFTLHSKCSLLPPLPSYCPHIHLHPLLFSCFPLDTFTGQASYEYQSAMVYQLAVRLGTFPFIKTGQGNTVGGIVQKVGNTVRNSPCFLCSESHTKTKLYSCNIYAESCLSYFC